MEKGVLKPLQVSTIEGDKTVNARHYVAPSGSGSLVEHFLQEAGEVFLDILQNKSTK